MKFEIYKNSISPLTVLVICCTYLIHKNINSGDLKFETLTNYLFYFYIIILICFTYTYTM